jgi:hypothetical protein
MDGDIKKHRIDAIILPGRATNLPYHQTINVKTVSALEYQIWWWAICHTIFIGSSAL